MLNAKNLFQRFGSGFMLAMMSLSALGSAAPAVVHARNEMKKTSENTRTVTLAGSENGALTFGDSTDAKKKFNIGEEVTLNVKPKDGYSVEQIYVVDSNQELVDSKQDANEVKFTMPDHDVKVYSNFKSGANVIRGPTKYTKGNVSITKDDGSELSFNENDYSEGSKFDLNVKFKDGHVPVSILLKDGKGNVLKDVKMSKNGDSIKYSVEKAPKSLDVFVMTTDIKNLVSEKSDSNYQGEDLTYDGFKKKLNKIDKSKVPNLKDPERVGLFVVKHTMFDESVITEKDRFTDLYKDASDIKTYDMKKVSALLGQVSEETLVYDVSNDSDYYVTYVRPFDGSKVNSVEMAENNIAGYLVNDIHYDMESGLAYIPKKYFDNYKQHNKEATVDNLSPVQMQFMERRKGDRKLPVRVNMYADGNFSSDLVSSEVLNTRIDEEKLTVKLPKKVSLSDVLVVANGIPVANSALYVSDGVLTIAQKSATYGTVDIYYRDGSKLISYFGSKFDDRLTQYGQKDEYSKIEPNTLIPTAYAVSVGDLSYNAGNARFSSDVNIGDIFTLTGYSYPKPSAVENASSTGAYPSGVWGYGGTTSSGVPASTASVLNWIVGRGGSQPGHVVEPPSNGSNNSVEIFGHTYFFSPTGEGGAGTGVAHTRGMEFNGETLTGSSGSVTLNSSGMITVGCYHIAVNGESNVIVRGGDGRPYDSRTMYLRVADIQVGPDGSGYVVFGMYLPMYGSQSGGGFFKMTAQIPPRKGDYRVRKSFESVKSNYYNKQATFTMTPINIANQGVVTKTVNGDGEILFEDLMAGQYVLTESAGNGFEPTMSQTVTVVAGQKGHSAPSSNISNRAKRGNFNLQKDTGDNYISGKNKNYSLAGAQYELVLKNDNSLRYTLTTNEQGQASLQNIERGEYTLREISAPRGYALNTQGEDVSVTNETNGKQTRDNPRYDPVVLTLEKADKERNALNAGQYGPQGNASLVGAVFTLTLYEENNLTEAQIKAGQGTKLWSVDITTKDVNGKAVAKTSDKSYLSNYVPYKTDAASLDNIFDVAQGRLKIAGGTFAVVEKSAPTGYLVDGVQFNGKSMFVKNVDTNGPTATRVTVEQPTNETVKATEDKKEPGRLKFNKKDFDSHGIVPQGDAEMKTTTFDVYNKSKNPIVYDGREYVVDAKVTTVTVDPTTLVATLRNELPYGEYEVVEASTHESYHKSAPTQRATLDDAHRDMDLTFENQVKRGSIEIKKHDADTDSTTPQGDATLQATYTIKNKSKEAVFVKGKWYAKDAVITTVTTDLNSKTVKVDDLPVGTYLVEETGTHNTYHLGGYDRDNTTKFAETVHITPAKLEVKLTTIKGENETIAPENFVKRGSIKVEKHDNQTNNITPQGDAKLKATFNVVNKSANAIWYYKGADRTQGKLVKPNEVVDTITTDDKTRIATIANLPIGTYDVIETAASESYDVNPYKRTVRITVQKLDHFLNNANQGADDAAAANIVKRGGVQVKKIDNDFVRNEWAQGDAGFEGAEFTIINRSAEAVYNKTTNQKYDVGATVAVIRANAQGVAASGLDTLPIGTYEIYESKAPTGYLLNEKWRKKFSVTPTDAGKFIKLMDIPEKAKHDYNANDVSNKLVVADKVIRGGVRVHKFDTNRNTTEPKGDEETPQGDASIKGAVIEIVNKSPRHVFYEGKEYAPEAIIGTITTNDKGIAETANNVLPYGTYELREKTAPESYHLNNTWKVTFSIRENGKVVEANSSATSPLNEDVKRGSIEIKKHDADTDSTTPQGDATLQATYTIKNKSKEAVFVKGKWYAKDAVITTVTTDLNSKTVKVDDLPVGTYLVEETGTHNTYHLGGYDRDNTTKFAETVHITPAKLEVKLTTIKGENETIAPENFVKRGSIKVEKHDNQTNNITPQGDAKLKATFNVVNKSANAIWYYTGTDRTKGKLVKPNEVVDTITTDDKTRIATITNLPVGTYEVIETAASESYDINPYRRTVKVTAEKLDHLLNNANQGANDAAAANIVKRGGVQVKKIDNDFVRNEWAQGDAGFAGAEFTIINRSAEAVYNKATGQKYDVGATVAVIRANDKGVAASGLDTLPIGTYEIYESKAPTGYLLNEKWRKTFTVRPANAGTFIQFTQIPEKAKHNIDQNNANDKLAIADKVIRGDVRVHKFDHDRNTIDPKDDSKLSQGDATLEGAKLEVINKSPHHVFYNGKEYAPNDVIDVLTTDAKGDAGAKNLPYGTYMIREKSAPTGYLVNSEWTTTFSIRENGKVVESNSETTAPLNEKVIRGFVKVQKVDKERTTNRNENQGDATLAGAVISVINESKEAVYVNGKWHAKGEVVATMTTNDKGIAVLDNNASLPYGSYSLKETKASEGYLLNDKWKVNFQIREDNKVVDVTSQVLEQQIIRGDVEVIKQDLELSKSEAIAGKDHNGANGEAASLNGITFEVRNASAKSVNIAGKFVNPGEVVTTLVTKWNAERKQYMVETTGKYLPYGTYTVQEIATNNSYVLTDGAKRTFTIRKDGEVVKADKENKPLVFKNQVVRSDFEFVKIVDTTSERLHTVFTLTNVTTGERHVIVTDKNGEYYTDSTKGFEHDKETNANDGLLAKIDAKEMIYMKDVKNGTGTWFGNAEDGSKATPNNKLGALPFGKYKLQEVRTDTNTGLALQSFEFYVYRHERTVHGGTVTDDRVPPKVGTQALDKETNDHVGQAQGKRIITDRVKYQGARMYKEYTVEGTLMNAETGAPILVGGKPIKATKTFKAEQTDGYVDIEFVIEDASVLLGTKTVAFEDLLEGEIKVASHADINDEGQSVYYPKVKTSASDKATNDRITTHGGKQIFVDTVKYTDLLPGKEYTVKGTLMDKETKKPLMVDGKPVTSETKFKPEKKDGEVKLEFEVETKELSGKQIVVFERVEYGGKVVGVHEDIEDVEQTVNVPGLKTNASSKTTGSQMAPAKDKEVIVDKVTYKNLIVGKEYTIKGKLMNKATGKPVEGAEASKTFVADKKDGFVELEFVVDASKLAGETVVAFERLEFNKIDIAFHEDIEDNDQSVNIPKVGTKAQGKETGNNIVPAVGNQVIIDTVEYKNLIVGKEYTVEGKLMDKTTGKELLVDGKPVVGKTTFTPKAKDGKVEIEFTVPAEKLAGTSLVVFEDVLHGGKLVGFHHDINDEEQTVNIPHIGTTAKNKNTNTHTANAGKKQTIVDTVRYKNLVVGKEYTMAGQLMKKVNDGKPSEVGKEVTVKFTPKEKDGSIDLTFEVDLDELAGETVVAFETLKEGKVTIAVHHDINDEDQSVNIPKLKTNASDKTTGTQQVADTKERVIVDKVTYHNLRVGETYTVEGVLMDKETGKPLLVDGNEVKATKEFQPTEKDGVVELEFTIPEASLQGKTLVVFEDLLQDGKKVGTHSDINDEDQSVHVLKVGTTATAADGKTKELGSAPETKLKDFVKYENLKVGEKVYVEGRVHDKSTGEVLKDADSKEIVVRTEFEPKTANGVLEMEFTLDTSNLVDKELVVTEKVFNAKGVLIGEHFDLNDKGQTVKVLPKPETVKPNTGVDSMAGIVAMISVMAMVIGVAFIVLARRRNI